MPLSHYGWNVLLASLAVAGVLGVVLAVLACRGARARWWIVAGCLPIYLAAALFPSFTLVGWHGMLHQSYALACLRSIPPEDPLVAGYPLKYGWVGHWAIGLLAQWTHLAPLVLITILDVLMLPATMVAGALGARRLTSDRVAIGLAGVLAIWGVSLFHGTPLQEMFVRWAPWVRLDPRPIPLDKFFNPNQNQVGVLCSAGALWCVLAALTTPRPIARWVAGVGGFTLLTALVYPMAWSGIGLMIAGGGALVMLSRDARAQRRMVWCGVGAALATLPCLPYLASVGSGKNPWGSMRLDSDPRSLIEVLPAVLLFVSATAAIVWFGRSRLADTWRGAGGRATVLYLAGSAGALCLAALFIRVPTAAEYKFLLQACGPLACLTGIAAAGVFARGRWRCWVVLPVLSMGAGSMLAYRAWWPLEQPIAFDGMYVRQSDANLQAALEWLRSGTPSDAVIVARQAAVATGAGRSLLLGPDRTGPHAVRGVRDALDEPAPRDPAIEARRAMVRDGWMINTTTMGIFMLGHPTRFVFARRNLVESVLATDWPIAQERTLELLRREVPSRPLYVLTGDAGVAAKLRASDRFAPRYDARGWWVFELAPGR